MLWLKAFHVIFVVSWFAGLFYLPRLFVYHAQAIDAASVERFKIMERRLFAMMTIGAVAAGAFGVAMIAQAPGLLAAGWLKLKLALIALLIAYHIACYGLLLQFRRDANHRSHRWYRVFNEVPLLFLIAIVVLAVVKPL